MGRSDEVVKRLRAEVEMLRLEKLLLLRQLEFVVDQSNRDTLKLATIDHEGPTFPADDITEVSPCPWASAH